MSGGDDWQAGDLALCVTTQEISCGQMIHHGYNAAGIGSIRNVKSIGVHQTSWCGCVSLFFTDGSCGLVQRFRKIRPHTPDAEDVETIRLLNGAPVKEPTQ